MVIHPSARILVVLVALAALATGALFARTRDGIHQPDDSRETVGNVRDTIVVFGPKRFRTPTGARAMHVERFAAPAASSPGRAYVLRITSEGRVTAATVRLSGAAVEIDLAELAAGAVDRPVHIRQEDTLTVELMGDPDASLTFSLLSISDPTFNVFGPTQYTRSASSSDQFTAQFALPADAATPHTFHLINGDESGNNRLSSADVTLNGTVLIGPNDLNQNIGSVTKPVQLQTTNTLVVELSGSAQTAGGFITIRFTATDTVPPVIALTTPAPGAVVGATETQVSGTVQDRTPTEVTVNGQTAALTGDAFSVTVPLGAEGEHTISVSAIDGAGLQTDSVRTVRRDTQQPVVSLASPADGLATSAATVTVSGTVTDQTETTVNVNGVACQVDAAGAFSLEVSLEEGANFLTLVATDAAGNIATVTRQVTRDATPPTLTVISPADDLTVETASVSVAGSAQDASALSLTVNGNLVVVASDASFSESVDLVEGGNTITVVATDAVGNSSTEARTVTRLLPSVDGFTPGIPVDVSLNAPPIDNTGVPDMRAATSFLYTGPNAVQVGVADTTIEFDRAAVVRGRVMSRSGQPLAGVSVTVIGHPEFGSTVTRSNGLFDMAVNGDTRLRVGYFKQGYLPIERTVDVPWQDYTVVEQVTLIPLDTQVTVVDFSTAAQVARGTPTLDERGQRTATMIFEQGTQATLVMPDGSTQSANSISVRASEFTVGPGGPRAMPGPLPPAVAYTYAVELSADEAIAAGASEVRFSKPVAVYVDNFLDFWVGQPVPAGYFDRERGQWIAAPDGRIIEIVGEANGQAIISADSTLVPADSATLASLGIDSVERARLAELYEPGKSLWRVEVSHFTPWDFNWPSNPLADALAPVWKLLADVFPGDCCKSGGSVIGIENQSLGEDLALSGVPFDLHYSTERTPGYQARSRLRVQVLGDVVPASLESLYVEIETNGYPWVQRFDSAALSPRMRVTLPEAVSYGDFDPYGREWGLGQRGITASVTYVYRAPYSSFSLVGGQSFGGSSRNGIAAAGGVCTGTCVTPRTYVRRQVRETAEMWDARRSHGLGGWSLSPHHAYDPVGRTLYQGDGRVRRVSAAAVAFRTVAGTGPAGRTGDGGPATEATIYAPDNITFDGTGAFYFNNTASSGGRYVRQVDRGGVIRTVRVRGRVSAAGQVTNYSTPQAVPGDQLAFNQGRLYFLSIHDDIEYVGADSMAHEISPGANGVAFAEGIEASVAYVGGNTIEVGNDGTIYVTSGDRVRRIAPDGRAYTVIGTNEACTSGMPPTPIDGRTGQDFRLCSVKDIALLPDGSLLVLEMKYFRILRVAPDGVVHLFAGTGTKCNWTTTNPTCGEGKLATEAPLEGTAESIDAGADGDVYVLSRGVSGAVNYGTRVRRIGADGIVTLVAGRYTGVNWNGDLLPALLTVIPSSSWESTVGPDGYLYVVIGGGQGNRILRAAPALPGRTDSELAIASEDGSVLDVFAQGGRHLRTVDASTGRTLLTFGYSAGGSLVSIEDVNGNVTTVERDANGAPTGIVGPYGQRTRLHLGANGNLASVVNAAGDSVSMTYEESLLETFRNARGFVSTFEYDSLGRLILDTDAVGGDKQLVRHDSTVAETGEFTIGVSSAEGVVREFSVKNDSTRAQIRRVRDATGLETVSRRPGDGSTTTTLPDGTVITMSERPDHRFGMQSSINRTITTKLPSGLTSTMTTRRVTALSNTLDPLSVIAITDSLVLNGRVFTSVFDRLARTITSRTPEARQTVSLLDSLDRVQEVQVPGLLPVTYDYDERGRLLSATQGQRNSNWTYGSDGRADRFVNAMGDTTGFRYDSAGRLTQTLLPGGREVQFDYDRNGNLTGVTPAGQPVHQFHYSAVDLDTSYVAPALADSSTTTTRIAYDLDRRPTRITRPDEKAITFGYDSAGRPDTITFPHGQTLLAYSATTGNLVSVSAPGGVVQSFTYEGSLPKTTTWSGPVQGNVGFTYDSLFRVKTVAVNGANTLTMGYDRDGFLTSAGGLTLVHRPDNGLLDSATVGTVGTKWHYDEYAAPDTVITSVAGAKIYERRYLRDSLGRITILEEVIGGVSATYAFAYDSSHRLSAVRKDGLLVESYGYDQNGNRLEVVGPGGTLVAAYDEQDRLLSYGGATYSFTAAGELKTKVVNVDTTRYEYDITGNLRDVWLASGEHIEYVIDAQNRRIGKRVNGTLVQGFLYQGALAPVAELNGQNQVLSRFVFGTRSNVPDYMVRGGATYRLITDHIGSVRLVVDVATGVITQRLDYDAWGRVLLNTNPGFQPFGYAGGLYDSATGLVRFGARDYDPLAGRWTVKDPIGFAAGSTNLYAYVDNDPINFSDPFGLCSQKDGWTGCREVSAAEGVRIFEAANAEMYNYHMTGRIYALPPERAGGKVPNTQDCSGFVWETLARAGFTMPYLTTGEIAGQRHYKLVDASEARQGDIIWRQGHVGIYSGEKDSKGRWLAIDMGGRSPDLTRWLSNWGNGSTYGNRGPVQFFRPMVPIE